MNDAPLAERLRPRSLDDVIGQQHLLGPGKPLRVAFESGEPHSMILWGPPGVGKTTLARLMADSFQAEFIRPDVTMPTASANSHAACNSAIGNSHRQAVP